MAERLQEFDIVRMATFPITDDTVFVPAPRKPGTAPRRAPRWGSGIVEEHHFLRMLCLERKRTERSGNPFMLMLIDGGGLFQSSRAAKVIRRIEQSVVMATRETDTLGWYEHGRTLAVLFTEIGSPDANANSIIRKVTTAVEEALGIDEFDALEISFRVFPERSQRLSSESIAEGDDADLTFYPDALERHDPKKAARFFKRSIDVAGSILILAVIFPVLLAIAILVRFTSEGPVLFRQKRIGRFGVPFTFLKFRSMYANNDPKIHQEYVARLIQGNAESKQAGGSKAAVYKLTNDPRVTPLGRFLRKTSLDELPQLFNVLLGNMSLVGPRPPVPYEYDRYDIWHRRRVFEVKPGITGLWQVTGRSRTTFDEMVRLDLNYAKAWSVWLDLKILSRTPMAVVSGDGAY